jgi:glycosyltransferase involved in cell wall biosynthesis
MGYRPRLDANCQKDCMKPTLLIISHTAHYRNDNGVIVGWGPTVREINFLAKEIKHIYHIGCYYPGAAPKSSYPYTEGNITFVPIPPSGGPGLWNKLRILVTMPVIVYTTIKYLRKSDFFQLRLPTGMGVYLLPFITLFIRKAGWIKYAGNWIEQAPPLSYAFQRFWLKYCQRRKVTINGKWKGQPAHCLSFENPCLTEEDRKRGLEALNTKKYTHSLIASFAGRLEDAKGVMAILQALKDHEGVIDEMHFIGNGEERSKYEAIAQHLNVKVTFHGFLGRDEVFDLFGKSHLFLLPSTASEGFPKVIAEAANFGCVPIVSNISSIPQYVSKENGFVWNPEEMSFSDFFKHQLFEPDELKEKAVLAHKMASDFTFLKYRNRVLNLFFQKYV